MDNNTGGIKGLKFNMITAQKYVREHMSQPELYRQTAEAAADLAQACLKYLRSLEGTNPCEEQDSEVYMNKIIEEYSDVANAAEVARIHLDYGIIAYKAERWADRLKALEESEGANNE